MSKSLCQLLKEALDDEDSARKDYADVAKRAEEEGQTDVAESLKDIGEDESMHFETLRDLMALLKCPVEEKK